MLSKIFRIISYRCEAIFIVIFIVIVKVEIWSVMITDFTVPMKLHITYIEHKIQEPRPVKIMSNKTSKILL